MEKLPLLRPTIRPMIVRFEIVALAFTLCAGCATTKQVKSIVAESNAAMLATELPDLGFGGSPATKQVDTKTVAAKIDAFIAGHPDQKVAASALRVRQGVMYIASGQYELAHAAFADATELKTDRDKALKALEDPMIWWWQHAAVDYWLKPPLKTAARNNLEEFDKVIPKLNGSPEVRDRLAEMRFAMALHLAKDLQISEGMKTVFVDALNRYGAIFTANDITNLKSGKRSLKSAVVSTADKRCVWSLQLIPSAKEVAKALSQNGEPVKVGELDPNPAVQGFGSLVLTP